MTERPVPTPRASPSAPGGSTRRAARPPRRRLAIPIAGACVVLAGIGIFVWLVFFKGGGDSDTDKANDAITAGLALQQQGDLTGAYAKYTEALKYDSDNKVALYDLAVIDYQQANPGLAEQRYRQVLAIDPDYWPALYNLAIVEQSLGKDRYALSLYQQAVQVNPGDANTHFNLALMLRAMGYEKAGDAQMRIALRLDKDLKDPGGVPSPSGTPAGGASPTR